MLEQWDYTKELSTELKKAPLWLLSIDRLAWLIDNKRGTPSFLEVLAIVLPRSLPSRQILIWGMMQSERPSHHGEQNQAEIAICADALKANRRIQSTLNTEETNALLEFGDITREARVMLQAQTSLIRGREVDVKSLDI